jgi:hypothetical protein
LLLSFFLRSCFKMRMSIFFSLRIFLALSPMCILPFLDYSRLAKNEKWLLNRHDDYDKMKRNEKFKLPPFQREYGTSVVERVDSRKKNLYIRFFNDNSIFFCIFASSSFEKKKLLINNDYMLFMKKKKVL